MDVLPPRIESKIDKTDTCWLWTASLQPNGYGQLRWGDRPRVAHRVVWTLLRGPIPAGKQLDHRCHVRRCVNPDHLQIVTPGENAENRRGAQPKSSTGVRGVTARKLDGGRLAYIVQAKSKSVVHYGGYFYTLEEARAAAIALRNKLHTNNLRDRLTVNNDK